MASIILYKDVHVELDYNDVPLISDQDKWDWDGSDWDAINNCLPVSTSQHPSTALTNSALYASNYRELVVELNKHGKLGSNSKWKSSVCFSVDIIYTYIQNTVTYKEIHKVCLTSANCEVTVNNDVRYYTMRKYIKMPPVGNAQSILIKINNNTGGSINLTKLELKRSFDVNGIQANGNTIYSPTIEYADRYQDGWSVKFRENDSPLAMIYHADENQQFDGVNVYDGDAMIFIPSHYHDEPLNPGAST